MATVGGSIPNIVQGVTEQTEALALPTQTLLQENTKPSLVSGLGKRDPLRLVHKLFSLTTLGAARIHHWERSLSERFIFVLTDGLVRIFDRDTGAAKTVTMSASATAYLNTADPRDGLRLLTVGDYTFVTNRNQVCRALSTTKTTSAFKALISIKAANWDTNYKVYVNGSEQGTFNTDSATFDHTKTDFIATQLATSLGTNLGAGWTATALASAVVLERTDGASFTVDTSDSNGGDDLTPITKTAQRFSDLPAVAPDGHYVEIVGDQTSDFDNYFVEFEADESSSTVSRGVWREALQEGARTSWDPATMPHAIVLQPDGSFAVDQISWASRVKGDDTSNPFPSIEDRVIQGLCFFQNRLGFLADENIVLSQTGSYFDFFRSSGKVLVDSDPIDLAASHPDVATLYEALPFDSRLLLFSDKTQWYLEGSGTLTPTNASLEPLSEYRISTEVTPIAVGTSVFFVATVDGKSKVYEMDSVGDSTRVDATDITEHVPSYISSGVRRITASPAENVLVAFSPDQPNLLRVHNWHWTNRQKDQLAWHTHTFTSAAILDVQFSGSSLFVVLEKGQDVWLAEMNLAQGQADTDFEFVWSLDFRQDGSAATSTVYDAATDQTTITLSSVLLDPVIVAGGATFGGRILGTASGQTNVVVIDGALPAQWYSGERFLAKTKLNRFSHRTNDGFGNFVAVPKDNLLLRDMSVSCADTGYFEVVVEHDFCPSQTDVFSGKPLGGIANLIGGPSLADVDFRVGLGGRASEMSVTLQSSSIFPKNILAIDWTARMQGRRSRQ